MPCFHSIAAQKVNNVDSIEYMLSKIKDPVKRIDLMLRYSDELKGEYPEIALKYSTLAYHNSKIYNCIKGEINSLISIGSTNLYLGHFDKAKEYSENAIDLARKNAMKNEIAKAQSVLALIYQELGDFEKNAFYDFENLKYYEQIQDSIEIEITLGNIGIDFVNQKDYKRALDYLSRSLLIAKKIGDLNGIAYQYNNIANIYFNYLKDYKRALLNFQEALKINKSLKNKKQEGIYLMNIGSSFSELHQLDSAIIYFINAKKIFSELHNQLFIVQCQISLSEYYLKMNEINLSKKYADSALKVAQANNFKQEIINSALILEKNFVRSNDSAEAYKYSTIKQQVSDKMAEELNLKELYKLELQYNYDKEEKQRLLVQQKKNFWVSIIIVSLILIIIIVILIYSRQRIINKNDKLEKEKIESELNFKNKELALNIMALIKKNEMFSEIIDNLTTVSEQIKQTETKELLSKILKKIGNSADNKMLNEFSLQFQEVHTGFYEKLLSSYPELTQNELRLCAFLRLNMATKDISEITGQQLLTIDKARTRLRKKLGIANSEISLVSFLSQI